MTYFLRQMDVEAHNSSSVESLRSDPLGNYPCRRRTVSAQPTAVSQQIKQLTKAVGLPLFEQVGKRLYHSGCAESEVLKVCRDISREIVPDGNDFWQILKGLKKQGNLRLAHQPLNIFVRVCSFRHRYPESTSLSKSPSSAASAGAPEQILTISVF